MKITIKCPHCNESISLDVKEDGQIEICNENDIEISENEAKKFLYDKGIELG